MTAFQHPVRSYRATDCRITVAAQIGTTMREISNFRAAHTLATQRPTVVEVGAAGAALEPSDGAAAGLLHVLVPGTVLATHAVPLHMRRSTQIDVPEDAAVALSSNWVRRTRDATSAAQVPLEVSAVAPNLAPSRTAFVSPMACVYDKPAVVIPASNMTRIGKIRANRRPLRRARGAGGHRAPGEAVCAHGPPLVIVDSARLEG